MSAPQRSCSANSASGLHPKPSPWHQAPHAPFAHCHSAPALVHKKSVPQSVQPAGEPSRQRAFSLPRTKEKTSRIEFPQASQFNRVSNNPLLSRTNARYASGSCSRLIILDAYARPSAPGGSIYPFFPSLRCPPMPPVAVVRQGSPCALASAITRGVASARVGKRKKCAPRNNSDSWRRCSGSCLLRKGMTRNFGCSNSFGGIQPHDVSRTLTPESSSSRKHSYAVAPPFLFQSTPTHSSSSSGPNL